MAASPSLHLRIKATEGKGNHTYEVEMAENATVAQVKAALEAQGSVPADKQRVIYRGRVLGDDKTLVECQVESEHTLHMVEKLHAEVRRTGTRSEELREEATPARNGTSSQETQGGTQLFPESGMPNLGNLLQSIFSGMGLNMSGASVVLHPTAGGTMDALAQNSLTRVDINIPMASEGGENQQESTPGDAMRSMRTFLDMLEGVTRRYVTGPTVVMPTDENGPVEEQGPNRNVAEDGRYMSVLHAGVACDGCRMSPISGPRFKSLSEPDYDLCANCFRSHQARSHGPYTKIEMPVPNPPTHDMFPNHMQLQDNSRSAQQEGTGNLPQAPPHVTEMVGLLRSARNALASETIPAIDRAIEGIEGELSSRASGSHASETRSRGEVLQIASILHSFGSLLLEIARSSSALRIGSSVQERHPPLYLHESGRQPRVVLPVNQSNLNSLSGLALARTDTPSQTPPTLQMPDSIQQRVAQAGRRRQQRRGTHVSESRPIHPDTTAVREPTISSLPEPSQTLEPTQDWQSLDGSLSPVQEGMIGGATLPTSEQAQTTGNEVTGGDPIENNQYCTTGEAEAPPSTSGSPTAIADETPRAKRRKSDRQAGRSTE